MVASCLICEAESLVRYLRAAGLVLGCLEDGEALLAGVFFRRKMERNQSSFAKWHASVVSVGSGGTGLLAAGCAGTGTGTGLRLPLALLALLAVLPPAASERVLPAAATALAKCTVLARLGSPRTGAPQSCPIRATRT